MEVVDFIHLESKNLAFWLRKEIVWEMLLKGDENENAKEPVSDLCCPVVVLPD
jgi:hypothetical protein